MRTNRAGAILAGSALTLGLLSAAPSAHAADPEPKALTEAIAWVQGQLGANGLIPGFGGTGDYSLTADYARGLQDVGHTAALESVAQSLVAQAAQVGDGVTSFSSARAAAAIWASAITGGDATERLAQLEASIAVGGESIDDDGKAETPDKTVPITAAGRAIDKPFSSWTGTIGEAWAYDVLQRAGSAKADSVLGFLLDQQCADGWFRYSWSAIDAPDQTCDGDENSFADPDTTAYVAILLADSADADAQAAVGRAITWLLGAQQPDGGLAAGYDPSAFNANTTGLAARAFALNDRAAAAAKAATWVRRHQAVAVPGCSTPLNADHGAIAATDSDLDAAAGGIGPMARGGWQFAAGQAFAALAELPATAAKLTVTAPTGYRAGGSAATIVVKGAAAGDTVCVKAGATAKRLVTDAAGNGSIALTLPRATTTLPVTAAAEVGPAALATVKVLGAAKPAIKVAKKVKRRKAVTVRVSGLAAREHVTLRLRGKVVKRGIAGSAGRYVARVKLGKKPGRAKLVVTGQFANRTNRTTIKVLR